MKERNRKAVFLSVMVLAAGALAWAMIAVTAWAADIPQLKPEELKALIEKKDASIVVVDVQPKGAYDLGHVKGAINFPWAMEIKSPGSLPRNKTLILYCDCSHEEDSTDVAEQLMSKFGYKNIKLLEGGWSKWQQLGYPVDKK